MSPLTSVIGALRTGGFRWHVYDVSDIARVAFAQCRARRVGGASGHGTAARVDPRVPPRRPRCPPHPRRTRLILRLPCSLQRGDAQPADLVLHLVRDLAKPVAGRDLTTTLLDKRIGTSAMASSSSPSNWQHQSGRWHPLDARLEQSGAWWRTKSTTVAAATRVSAVARVPGNGWSPESALCGSVPGVVASVEWSTATCPNLVPGIPLVYRRNSEELKEELALAGSNTRSRRRNCSH